MKTFMVMALCLVYTPVFFIGAVAQFMARLLLSVAYLLLFDFLPAGNVLKSAFSGFAECLRAMHPKRLIKDLTDIWNGK